MSTRNRLTFDGRGWCSACQWMETKQTLDWSERLDELNRFLDKHRSRDGGFDCIVPVSGGKDGAYVAYTLKHRFGMNPLTVTIQPDLPLEIGDLNLKNFIASGFDHVHITPNPGAMRTLNKYGLIEMGFPYYGWLIAVKTAVIKTALSYNIPLIFYGEDGEVEYGGSTEKRFSAHVDIRYMKKVIFESGYEKVLNSVLNQELVRESELYFFRFPSDADVLNKEMVFTHWSYFENWDSYRNYVVAKEHCGLTEREDGNSGTFTNFAQNDQALYPLHVYLMYLKYGFGRATQDAGIEIRRGAMVRDQAINLVNMYDNGYPEQFVDLYLDYYRMTRDEFDKVLDVYTNKDLFVKIDGRWSPRFTVGEDFSI